MFSHPLMYNGYDDGSGNGYGAFDLVANPHQPIDPDTFTKMMSGTYSSPTGSGSTGSNFGSDSGTPCIPNLEKLMQPIVFHKY